MDKNDVQSKLMDYLYDEMGPNERREFEKLLRNQPELQQELNEMQATRNLLQEESDEITPKKLMLIRTEENHTAGDKTSNPSGNPKIYFLKTFAAVAAAILVTVAVFSFVNLQINQTEQGTLISFGTPQPQPVEEPAETESFITEDEFYTMMSELQEQNNHVMATALEQTREQHQQQMENVIQTLTTYYNRRRQQDLVLVSEGLAQLEEETYYRFLQTEEALEDLIFALNVQQPNE
ncbi:hypothetical protein [Rhodohalobacter sp. 8-1]|uniref:hypothetical protein n=1 Tax=Rhodohalobacter sp. 8-1 TaxID=3131972 RepID=UPI0030ECB3F1